MSSLRNAVKRITHKERAQPRERAHLGFLEKKKDYVKRAKDYHKKEDLVKRLRQKASMRNPDEFYFGMHNSKVSRIDGKHRKTEEARRKEFDEMIGHDTIRIMKDQDLAYIRMQLAKDRKKVEKLQSSLHVLGDAAQMSSMGDTACQRKHTIFVDSREEAENFNATQHFDTLPELVGRVHNRPKKDQIRKLALDSKLHESDRDTNKTATRTAELKRQENARMRRISRARTSAYKEIQARSERIKALQKAEAHLVTEKLVASKGHKRKLRGEEDGMPAQYLWRTKRAK